MERTSEIKRKTNETNIHMQLNIDGKGCGEINSGIGFFDHMLGHIAKHGFFDITLTADGDLEVDSHHTIEDIGITFGQCVNKALGNKVGIKRYGYSIVPMDETLVLCALDLSGRPLLCFDVKFSAEMLGGMQTEMMEEFFRAVSVNAGMNLHIKLLNGINNHHIAEGVFKAFGKALDMAVTVDERIDGVLSTKGMLE